MILPRYEMPRIYLPASTVASIYSPGGDLICKTLELPWRNNAISTDPRFASCISEGIYLVAWQPAKPTRPYEYFRIMHVPGRHWHEDIKASSCLFHRANKAEQLLGCVAPGSRHVDIENDGDVDIADSARKLEWMAKNMPRFWELHIYKKTA
jgi:hypothetical protein